MSQRDDVFVRFKKLHTNAKPPEYQTIASSGADLCTLEKFSLSPGARLLVHTGIAIELPEGYEAQIRARSGLALKHGVTVLNGLGTIDSDYRGEICVILINNGDSVISFFAGDRIAQVVIAPVARAHFLSVEQLNDTNRGEGGFGSTGK